VAETGSSVPVITGAQLTDGVRSWCQVDVKVSHPDLEKARVTSDVSVSALRD
jgi:hypothetical protein